MALSSRAVMFVYHAADKLILTASMLDPDGFITTSKTNKARKRIDLRQCAYKESTTSHLKREGDLPHTVSQGPAFGMEIRNCG